MDDVDVLPSQLIASPSIEDYDDDDDDVVDMATSPYWVLASAQRLYQTVAKHETEDGVDDGGGSGLKDCGIEEATMAVDIDMFILLMCCSVV
ncbi:hypothetical protein V1524DRAFT_433599 [Lipomyces starkeyi]